MCSLNNFTNTNAHLAGADGAKPHLAACGAAAAWRLGQWELLAEYLARTHTSGHLLDAGEQWEVRLGELLSGLHHRQAPQESFLRAHLQKIFIT